MDEVAQMMASVNKISNAVTHYASHRLRVNVKFSAIEKNMQSTKTDPYIVYKVPYHKQKVLETSYSKGNINLVKDS